MRVTAVIPVYNEADCVPPLAAELLAVDPLTEIIFVNDGSTDATGDRLDRLATEHGPRLRVRHQPRNLGQSAAMWTGFQLAEGEAIVCLDGDGQNDPADIPKLIEALSDCDVVCGRRAVRRDSWSRRAASRLGNRVRNWVTRDGIADTGCSLKAFRRECVPDLPPLRGMHRFMPAYFTLHGRRIKEIDVNHRPREHGRSKYTNLSRLPRTALDLFGFWWLRRRWFRVDASPED